MKILNQNGYLISNPDKLALENYMIATPKEWAKGALDGMINKAIKNIQNDYYDLYVSKQTETVSTDMAIVIPGIIAMPEFIPYHVKTPVSFDNCNCSMEDEPIQRDELRDIEIWFGGFEIEDYQYQALTAFYENPETMLAWFMENKIYQRRKVLVKDATGILRNDSEVSTIPVRQDALINLYVSRPYYKNAATKETERIAMMGL